MIRKDPSQLFEEDSALNGPQTDPAAAQWHSFVARESKQAAVKDSQLRTPVTSPTQSTTVRTQRPLKENSYSHQHNQHHHSNHYQYQQPVQQDTPTKVNRTATVNTNGLNLFSASPLCFCQKLASRSESGEFGTIYDCHYMSETNNEPICGFHVHQRTWQKMGDLVKKKQAIDKDDPELWSCPYFNFTYCVVFRVSNEAKKASPIPPLCFCNKRTTITECDYNSKRRICFTCSNMDSIDITNKCNWFLWAEEATFIRPKYPRHTEWTMEGFGSHTTADIIPRQQSPSVTTNREQHSLCLLTALTSAKLDSLKISEFDGPTNYTGISTDNNESEYSGDETPKLPNDQHKSLDELLYGSQHSYVTMKPDLTNSDSNRFIPTSVKRHTTSKQLDEDTQHQSNEFISRNALWDHMHQQSLLINTLQERGLERDTEMIELQKKLLYMQQENHDIKNTLEKQRHDIDTQISMRQHCQLKLSSMEEELESLLEQNSALALEVEAKQMISSVPKEPKCQVCFSVDVECAVVPCFHAVYCLSCAHKLKECAICRMPKFSIQKVYLC